ncbi:hypothetical protein Smp_122730 [Schistosoma mansoni]|uniref:hypothetical protein n=1 Tax=Schistosoma mansoni TaxID=6183 RepID=UPI00022DC412|nr:hypothetical protein Smp_122730 [Schistosoma mansoni]|eukprot:XP_018650618.1 hypothetical protein Smp_122730 [Schistosoma mansoni]
MALTELRNLLLLVLDMTPATWGSCKSEFGLPNCIEAVLGFANSHLMLSPHNELAVIGVTPSKIKFIYPNDLDPPTSASNDGQNDALSCMNNTVRQLALSLVTSCSSTSTQIVLAGAIIKALCYYLRRCRELQPSTRHLDDSLEMTVEFSEGSEKISSRILIIKASDDNSSQYLALMNSRKMGYEHGQGLGVNAHGVVEPVALSKQKGRSGLGSVKTTSSSDKKIESLSGELYQSSNPNLVWHEGCDDDYTTADGDYTWSWSMEGECPTNTLSELKSLIISPDEPEALGPPIEELDNEDKFCSTHLVQEVLNYKNQLDYLSKLNVTKSHERCNPYELIKKGIFMNRAAMKMANIDSIFNGMFTTAAPKDDILYFADICAGPGGFSEYTLWRRCNAPYHTHSSNTTLSPNHHSNINDKLLEDTTESIDHNSPTNKTSTTSEKQQPLLSAKGFGLTLTGQCDFRENDFLAGPKEAFMAHYGAERDGDVTKWSNLASFASFIGRSTNNAGVHILMADGGFDVSSQYNLQEVMSKQLYLCQCLCALINLRPGGHFLTKLFDTFTEFTIDIIYIMGYLFEEIYIIKPVTSRPANSERFAKHQCVALSKLLAFSQNHNLTETRQNELYRACLEKWKIPITERRPIPWPLLSTNRSAIIRRLLGDSEHFTSLNALPSDYRPNIRLTPFTNANVNNLDILYHSRIALVCGNPSITSTSEPAQPMFIYSHGSAVTDTYCTVDGDQWNRLDQMIPRLNPRLPPSTLIWGQPFYEYAVKNGLRKHGLFIYDVVCIYGRDCRKLPYRKRLPLLPCKDSPTLVPMHCLPDGFTFQPHSLLLVQHMTDIEKKLFHNRLVKTTMMKTFRPLESY